MKKFKFEIKEMQEDGTFFGVASMYGNVDYGGDVVEKGAFTKTITEKKTIPILWQHKQDMPLGIGELQDTDRGLMVKGTLNLDVAKSREAYSLIKQGAIKGLSIGYGVIKDKWEKGIRYLKEVRLWEVSLVTFPMNSEAVINSVKSVVSFQNLPLADISLEWDGTKAERNVREWATESDGNINWERYQKGFLWFDSDRPENLGSYKLGIADIIDGELKAIPRGIMTAAGSIQGARNKPDIPENDLNRIKSNVEKYYAKMDRIAPWNKSDSTMEEQKEISIEVSIEDSSEDSTEEPMIEDVPMNKTEKLKQIIQDLTTILDEMETEVEPSESVETNNSVMSMKQKPVEDNIKLAAEMQKIFSEMIKVANKK